jgi:alkylation response protein AidB-like acyl-CoA dehydrogenase
MADNFFLDNRDLQFRLNALDLGEALKLREQDYSTALRYPAAPRSYADAIDNYRLLLEVLGDICARVIAPRAAEADAEGAQFAEGEVRYALATQAGLDALRQADLLGVTLPWEYGGLNVPESVYALMVEMVARAEAGLMNVFSLQEVALMLAEYGDDETKARLLPRFARGELTGAMVLTEPDAGSDLGAAQTRATWDEAAGVWRLNGVKRFITNGHAAVQLVLARSEPDTADARGLSLFLVERDESVRVRRIEHKLGIRSSPTCEIQYTNTPARLVGKRRFGLIRYALAMMNGARLAVAAQAVGIAEAACREAQAYARARRQFDRPVCDFPAVSRMLLEMRREIEAARALVSETGRWVDLQQSCEQAQAASAAPDPALRQRIKVASGLADVLTPLAKYYATEMGNRVCYQALQIHGGVGYMQEFNVERHARDVRVTSIYEGTSQLQVVAALGKLLGGALDPLLDIWAAAEYPAALQPLAARWTQSTAQLRRAAESLKGRERDVIDYYAVDLVDMAIDVVTGWLLLRDARVDERKLALAQLHVAGRGPQVAAAEAAVLAADPQPLQARDRILEA